MVGPCLLCHLSPDARQSKLEKQTGGLPIPELAQLRRRRSRLEESELKFKPHVVSMAPVLEKVEAR